MCIVSGKQERISGYGYSQPAIEPNPVVFNLWATTLLAYIYYI